MIAIDEFEGVVYSLQHAAVWRIQQEPAGLEDDEYYLFTRIGDKDVKIAHGKERGTLMQFMKYIAKQANQDITLSECAERFDELSGFYLLKYIELDLS